MLAATPELVSYDRIVGLVLDRIAVDSSITRAPPGGEAVGRSPVDRGKQGLERSRMTDGTDSPGPCPMIHGEVWAGSAQCRGVPAHSFRVIPPATPRDDRNRRTVSSR